MCLELDIIYPEMRLGSGPETYGIWREKFVARKTAMVDDCSGATVVIFWSSENHDFQGEDMFLEENKLFDRVLSPKIDFEFIFADFGQLSFFDL